MCERLKVKDLIEKLSKFDPDQEICVDMVDGYFGYVYSVMQGPDAVWLNMSAEE